jgi:hypothetical protein
VKAPIVNFEENIEKLVGKRTAPADSFAAGMKLQETALQFHNSLGLLLAPRGVYRYKTHEEADEWMMRMLTRNKTKKS